MGQKKTKRKKSTHETLQIKWLPKWYYIAHPHISKYSSFVHMYCPCVCACVQGRTGGRSMGGSGTAAGMHMYRKAAEIMQKTKWNNTHTEAPLCEHQSELFFVDFFNAFINLTKIFKQLKMHFQEENFCTHIHAPTRTHELVHFRQINTFLMLVSVG